jgi:peptidoglycan/xylan/chitin deacetylase (PgdA/CDA1 family)
MGKTAILRTSMDLLYYSGTSRLLSAPLRGVGAIFMLHHIRPGGGLGEGFAPNAGLEVTPEFLDEVISFVAERNYELLPLAEAADRLKAGKVGERPFAVFTIDDGYRDNLDYAWPIFRDHACPFTIFIAPAITDGACELWWRGLEALIADSHVVRTEIDGEKIELATETDAQKQGAFERLYWPLRNLSEEDQRAWINRVCASHGIDLHAMCRAEAMGWEDLRQIAADPLCSIGAHTINHYAIGKLPRNKAMAEIVGSRDRIAREIGVTPDTFSYPYGDAESAGPREFDLVAEAGFKAAVTTRKGLVYRAHSDHSMALPRVSLNGGYQKLRYVDVLLSGTAFALWNGFRKVNAA